jgi:hypothetical protein
MTQTTGELSTAQLLQRATEQTTTLVGAEIHLAQLEVSTKAKRAGLGIGALGATGVLSLYAVAVLIAAAVLGLSTVLAGWLAALIVAGALLLVAAALAVVGKKQVGKSVPPVPTETIDSTRDDVAVIKNAAHR